MTTPIYRDATHRYMAARWQLLQALWRKNGRHPRGGNRNGWQRKLDGYIIAPPRRGVKRRKAR